MEIQLETNLLGSDPDSDGVRDGNESFTTTATNASVDTVVDVTGQRGVVAGVTSTRGQRLISTRARRRSSDSIASGTSSELSSRLATPRHVPATNPMTRLEVIHESPERTQWGNSVSSLKY